MNARSLILAWCALWLGCAAAFGQTERVTSYDSRIVISTDRSLTVTETIAVQSAGQQIRHGIYRDFPTSYTDAHGIVRTVPFAVIGATRDGRPESFRTQGQSNGVRVYLGDSNVLLARGPHTYTLQYRTDRQIGFFDDHDELYWNVTGSGWDFPIDQVSATVVLPKRVPASQLKLEAYTGPQGAQGTDYRSEVNADGDAEFHTTAGLADHQGLTIVVEFPKGLVPEPTAAQERAEFLQDNRIALYGAAGVLAVLVYCLVSLATVGRKPARGTIIPLFEAPAELSPAAVRFLMRMGYDEKCFTAAVIDMAVKGYLKIHQASVTYTLERQKGAHAQLAPEEEEVGEALFDGHATLRVDNTHHTAFQSAIIAMKKTLALELEKRYFFTNAGYLIPAAVGSVLTLAAMVLSVPATKLPLVGFLSAWLTIWSLGVFAMLNQIIAGWRHGVRIGSAGTAVFAIPFVVAEVVVIYFLIRMTTPWLAITLVLLLGLIWLFHHLLKSPTSNGRKLMDQIEGFAMYLGTAEEDELNALHPPEKTPEVFQKFLPYAVALGLENKWAARFTGVLEQAGMAGRAYAPVWYVGPAWGVATVGAFSSGLGTGLGGAISSASVAPGSSSGGGGGGSSGGGGGGGGGGGW